jgi:predicted Ser/Thr protein kinase
MEERTLKKIERIKVLHGDSIALIVDNPTELKLIDKGAHGAVFRIDNNRCVKIYADKHNAEKEATTYRRGQGSEIIPKLYEVGDNYIIIEYLKGETLWKHLSHKREISYELAQKIVNLLKEMKRLGFTRIDSSMRHIFITDGQKLKVIDLVYAYVRNDTKPVKIFRELSTLGLVNSFMEHVKKIDKALYMEWSKAMSEFIK